MISKADFAAIDTEIKDSIEKTLKEIKDSNQNTYALFLSNGEYEKDYDTTNAGFNPNVIDYRMDGYKDNSRISFLAQFLSNHYSFKASQTATDDDQYRMHIELMVYTHIWESKSFLKQLYRLAQISGTGQYPWEVKIPDMSKHDFIRNDIRQVFEDNKNNLSEIIRKGFHTSLRNSFAHSEYSFDTINGNKRIILHNFNGAGWELNQISYDEWSGRFVYSSLLSYYLMFIVTNRRRSLVADTGTDSFQIKQPSKINTFNYTWIKYDTSHDNFYFEQ